LKTDAFVETAIATRPGTPHVPPFSHERAPGGLEIALAINPPIGKYVPPAPPVPILKNFISCADATPANTKLAAITATIDLIHRFIFFPHLTNVKHS
jgi:hypothetical protein